MFIADCLVTQTDFVAASTSIKNVKQCQARINLIKDTKN